LKGRTPAPEPERFGLVDVGQQRQQRQAAAQAETGFGIDAGGTPGHALEIRWAPGIPSCTYGPEAAVCCRPDNPVMALQEIEGGRDELRRDARNIGADQQPRPQPSRLACKLAQHARAEIPWPLRQTARPGGPAAAPTGRAIGSYRHL